ncbi:hypothetical protein [Cohnella massiliensis]|uniref:hypothetical protein n=1 Tax=Cohnella massiliensis TaxID=1816691 RepID=UPI0009B9B5E1|nr:hypothetical protein [Cohnella massiliensis]
MAKIIFKQLHEAVYTVRKRLQSNPLVDEEAKRLEESRYAALMEIVEYTRTQDFLTHKSVKNKIRFFFNSNYNYKLTAEHFNCPLNNIESTVSYAGKCLEKRIGRDTIRLVMQAQTQDALDAAMLQFRIGINPTGTQSLFVGDLSKWFPEPSNMGFRDLSEFRKEMRLLFFFSIGYFKECFAQVDQKRLAHLLYILQSTDNAHVMERQVLYRLLQGEYQDFVEAWEAWTTLEEKSPFEDRTAISQ